jgi:hypothetical protein
MGFWQNDVAAVNALLDEADGLSDRTRLVLEVFNLFNAKASDIDYFYRSRLAGEPAEGVDDIHTHPVLPRSMWFGVQVGL